MNNKTIIISAVNFYQGGPLTILLDLLDFLNVNLGNSHQVIALVHKKELFPNYENLTLLEFPTARKSYLNRFYFEYYFFKNLSKRFQPDLWFSLHDMTPNVIAKKQVVYCHNPSPFYKIKWNEIKHSKTSFLFKLFYEWIYRINIKKNTFVIVQQDWLRDEFVRLFHLDEKKVIVAYPSGEILERITSKTLKDTANKTFFYPAFPRVFKNFSVVCEAVKILEEKGITNFRVLLTLDGSENSYANAIVAKYKSLKCLDFIGLQPIDKVYEIYHETDWLIFPSKLETWGLPLTEFKSFNKPMLVADLPYAKETVGDYDKVIFFNEESSSALAFEMEKVIAEQINYHGNRKISIANPHSTGWDKLFELILR